MLFFFRSPLLSLISIFVTLGAGLSAQAGPSASFAHRAKIVSLKDFYEVFANFNYDVGNGGMGNGGECSFHHKLVRGTLTLGIQSQNGGAAVIGANASSTIILVSARNYPDGSYSRKYIINGRTSFALLSADDAFVSFTVGDGTKTLRCEIDF